LGEVAKATSSWRSVAKEVGAKAKEIARMASAFEHAELRRGNRRRQSTALQLGFEGRCRANGVWGQIHLPKRALMSTFEP
jgi:hypothetical protein